MQIPSSSELLNAKNILEKLNLKAGMVVADLGCGTSGHFALPSSAIVGGDGKVYAVDIVRSALSGVGSRAKLENATNIDLVWADIEVLGATKIKDETCDFVYLINVHAKNGMVQEALRILKIGGKLLIMDWKAAQTPFGPPSTSRVSKVDVKNRLKDFKMKLIEEFEPGPYHWALVYQK